MTIRSTGGRVAAYAWLVFAALNLADLAFGLTGDTHYNLTTATIAVLLLLGCGLAYAMGLRPAILGDEEAVTLRNPLRDVRAPWRAVREIQGTHAVVVRFAGPDGAELKARAWVHQTSPRAQAKAEARARRDEGSKVPGAHLKGRTPAAYAAQQLNEIRDRHRPRTRSGAPDKAAAAKADASSTTGTISWALPALASLAIPLVALVVLAVAALVN
ncbi:PH domain-containing protein [Actinomadura rubrisoli]|uniref:PH domain-containing protein n=1 Tax=Actinomadura rubrisoli TaxID=2530368 RepID=A0A4R5C269_9ACTN|nr:PH domain-containing protein [Actinomadura rubrisoli]TDD93711.1 PH domain-containing protein [Actinomadura rubrisoli]